MKMKRSILLSIVWVAVGSALLFESVLFDVDWNLFTWKPELDFVVLACALTIPATLTGIWFLARATRDQVTRVISLIVCMFLAGFAITVILPFEPASGGFLGRTTVCPLWFRGGLTLAMSIPSAFWILWFLRLRKHPAQQPGPAG
jgi:hypothetical protein